jgi:hypothetical protein
MLSKQYIKIYMSLCLNCCVNETKSKFCSSSCSAKYNNRLRVRSKETNQKISYSLKGRPNISNPKGNQKLCRIAWCQICNSLIKNKRTKTCSEDCTSKLQSLKAKERLRKGRWNTNAQWYESPYAGRVFLESSWEVIVALELDKNNIKWIRPKFINYTLNNTRKSYYPDFYLIDYDVYLDPKK